MFEALIFVKNEYGFFNVRSAKIGGFNSLKAAQNRILKLNVEGYIKQRGVSKPVWSNVI